MEYKGTIQQEEGLEIAKFLFPEFGGEALEEIAGAGRGPPKVHRSEKAQPLRLECELVLIPDTEEPTIVVRYSKDIRALAFSRTPRVLPNGGGRMKYELYVLDPERARELYETYTEAEKQEGRQ